MPNSFQRLANHYRCLTLNNTYIYMAWQYINVSTCQQRAFWIIGLRVWNIILPQTYVFCKGVKYTNDTYATAQLFGPWMEEVIWLCCSFVKLRFIQWNRSATTTSLIKFITCDSFSNVFYWRLKVPNYSFLQFLLSGAHLGGPWPSRWAPEGREVSQ